VCASYQIEFFTVLLNAVDRKILLLPVRVHHVENAQTWFPTLLCSATENTIQSCYVCQSYVCVSRLQLQNMFFRLTKDRFIYTRREKPEVDIIMPSLASYPLTI